MAPRFEDRKQTLLKKCWELERDFGVKVNTKIIADNNPLYGYKSSDWAACALPSSTAVKGPGDFLSHNEAIEMLNGLSTAACDIEYQTPAVAQPDDEAISTPSLPCSPTGIWGLGFENETPLVRTPTALPHALRRSSRKQRRYGRPMPRSNPPSYTPHTPRTIAADEFTLPHPDSRRSSTQEMNDQRTWEEATALPSTCFDSTCKRSSGPLKRSYSLISEMQKPTSEAGDMWHGADVKTENDNKDTLSKRRRTDLALKPEATESVASLKKLLGSVAEFVPPPPSLVSPLRSTR